MFPKHRLQKTTAMHWQEAAAFLAPEYTHDVYVRIPEFKTEYGLTLDISWGAKYLLTPAS